MIIMADGPNTNAFEVFLERTLTQSLVELYAEGKVLKAQERVLRGLAEAKALPDELQQYLTDEYNADFEAWQAQYDWFSNEMGRLHPERVPQLAE